MNTIETDVLIIGAGPTGLMAANQLKRFGVEFILIDSKSGPTEQSRAIAVTARSLEIYEQMGIVDEVLKNGQHIESFHFFTDGKERGKLEIGNIGEGYSDYKYLLGYEQSKNEELLFRNLGEHQGDVKWETTFVELTSYEESITIVAKHKQEQFHIKAKYLIACDGAGSPVRHQLEMPFKGGTYENKFFVADTVLKWDLGYNGLIIAPGKHNFVAFFPMKGKSNYRVIGTLPLEYFKKPDISFEDIGKVVADTVGIEVSFEKVNWFSIYNLHHRRVDQFRKGRVFLAGDAAHIHSPAGGQGMNTGLQDAYNLSWKLSFVLKGMAKPALLDTYNEERLPFAKWLMSFTDRGFKIMTSDQWFIGFLRKYLAIVVFSTIMKVKWTRVRAFITVSQIWYSYSGMSIAQSRTTQKLKFKAGDRLPYVMAEGTRRSIYHLFTQPEFHLLCIGVHTTPDLSMVGIPVTIVHQPLSGSWIKLGVRREIYILVRPDNYIAFITDTMNQDVMVKFLSEYFITEKG